MKTAAKRYGKMFEPHGIYPECDMSGPSRGFEERLEDGTHLKQVIQASDGSDRMDALELAHR